MTGPLRMILALGFAVYGCSTDQAGTSRPTAATGLGPNDWGGHGGVGAAGDPARTLPAAGAAAGAGAQAGMTACQPDATPLSIVSVPLSAAAPLHLEPGVALVGDGLAQTLMATQNPGGGLHWQGDRLFLLSDTGFWDIATSGAARWYPTDSAVLWGVRAGDLDGDGDQDLLLLSMALNTSPASGTSAASDADAGPVGTPSPLLSRLTIWERTSEGLSERSDLLRVAAMSFPMPYAIGDIDADGDLDIVTFERGVAAGYLNQGGLSFERTALSEPAPDSEGVSALLVDLADRNGDGLLDLLVIGGDPLQSPLENSMFVLLGQERGRFAPKGPSTTGKSPLVPYGPDGIGIGIADVTGDGLADVITQDPAQPEDGIMRLHKSVSATELAPAVELNGLGFAFADLDADGRTDIITTSHQRLQALLSRATGELELQDLGLDLPASLPLKFVADPGVAGKGPVLHVLRQQPTCP